MGLINARNIAKAKALAEKNKDKIAAGVTKATDAIDKKTGGKHTDKLKKIDDAAKKFAGPDGQPGAAPTPDADAAAAPVAHVTPDATPEQPATDG